MRARLRAEFLTTAQLSCLPPRDNGPDAVPARDPLEQLKSEEEGLQSVIEGGTHAGACSPVQKAVFERMEIDERRKHEVTLNPQAAPAEQQIQGIARKMM